MERRTKFILLTLYVLFFVALGLIIGLFGTPICLRPDCEKKASHIIEKMDQEVNPCKDFHTFLCGKKTYDVNIANKTENTPSNVKNIIKLMKEKYINYYNILKVGLPYPYDPKYEELLIIQYNRLCTNFQGPYYDEMYKESFRQAFHSSLVKTGMIVNDIFYPENFNQSVTVGIYEYYSRMAGFAGNRLFSTTIKLEMNNKKKLSFIIGLPINLYNMLSEIDGPDQMEYALRIFILKIYPYLNLTLDNMYFVKLFNFANEIKTISKMENPTDKSVESVNLHEFQKRYPDLDLRGHIRQIVGDDNKMPTHFFMLRNSKRYFKKLEIVFNKPQYTRYFKVLYIVANHFFDLVPLMALTSTVTNVVPIDTNLLCTGLFAEKLAPLFYSLFLDRFDIQANDRAILDDIYWHMKILVKDSMKESAWMDKKTKKTGLNKLQSMTSKISLPKDIISYTKNSANRKNYYKGFCYGQNPVDCALIMYSFLTKREFDLFQRDASAFDFLPKDFSITTLYDEEKNQFNLPSIYTTPPLFSDNWPLYINFGVMGTEMALEFINYFNDLDLSDAGKTSSWWTNTTYKNYEKMYHGCSKLFGESTSKVNSEFTMVMALRMAYKAYLEYKKKNSYKDALLPGLEMYTHEQVLFLSHAHLFCESSDTKEENTVRKKYFNAISSLYEFREAFGCKIQGDAAYVKAVNKCMLF